MMSFSVAPGFEIHPAASRQVQSWMDYNDVDSAPKPIALMRRDRNDRLQVWSWHVSELSARRAINHAGANRIVR
jgi:hypothetical protein